MMLHSARLTLGFVALLLATGCSEETTRGGSDGATTQPDGGTTTAAKDFVPADNAVSGWTEDNATGAPGVEAADNDTDIEGIINGHHAPYAAEGTSTFAKQDYAKGNFKLSLELWQMNAAAGAKAMFDKNKSDGETQSGLTFETIPDVTEAAILAVSTPQWKAYGHKGRFVYMVIAEFSAADERDPLKAEVITFVTHLAGQLP